MCIAGDNAMKQSGFEGDIEQVINGYGIPWQQLEGKRVLVTGASGFVASHICEVLLCANQAFGIGSEILGLVRDTDGFAQRFSRYLDRSDLACIEQNLNLPLQMPDIGKVDFIIHAASKASPRYFGTDPIDIISTNIIGTRNLLEFARHHEIDRFLYVSSAEVYGQPAKVPTSESDYGYLDPTDLRSCYAESKRMAENMCTCWGHEHSLPTSVVRLFHTYGPGMKLDDGRVYTDFIRNVVERSPIQLLGDGSATRSFCYIYDVVAAVFLVLLRGQQPTTYNVGNDGGEMSIMDFGETLVRLYPDRSSKVVKNAALAKPGYLVSSIDRTCPDITRLKQLGWRPMTTIESGLRKTVESYL
jgi:nucleoside-diphosphate-sugar epimerase